MSVQFGRWNIDGRPADQGYLAKAGEMLAPYGPDGRGAYIKDNVGILYRAFHTTKESWKESQPCTTPSGAVLTLDGRLDNREDLVRELRDTITIDETDVGMVAAAYEAWGMKCFAKLIGDWALSLWDPKNQALILAKDPVGTRHLYYSSDVEQITWSTILDPLVLLAGKTFALEEEYIAGWLSLFPAAHLTPYVGIHSVPPSYFVRLKPGRQTGSRFWDFDPSRRIRYRIDAEYEEHFRSVFAKAVQRRLRSDTPVLAELSGGRDSSSIVCMADTVIASGTTETPRLDTISYFDDSEPNWNERPYFTKVEEKRGRIGLHIDIGLPEKVEFDPSLEPNRDRFMAAPGHGGRISQLIMARRVSQENRVLLSGTGGDEVMGGVPTPIPELEDLLVRGRFKALARQLKVWALQKRKPWFHILLEAARGFFPPTLVGIAKCMWPAPWLQRDFAKHHWAALTGYPSRTKFFGPLPSFQESMRTLNGLQRQLAWTASPFEPLYEKRYPYLDRDLLEFMFAVPREQLVRPTQRRSLMRRALVGIVPDEILNKKGKAFVARGPRVAISSDWANLVDMTQHMASSSLGIVDAGRFLAALQKGRHGEEVPIAAVVRTIYLENWLRGLRPLEVIELHADLKIDLCWEASKQV